MFLVFFICCFQIPSKNWNDWTLQNTNEEIVTEDSAEEHEISFLCTDYCQEYPGDGSCDDGGPYSEYSGCHIGSDCSDCGGRYVMGNPGFNHDDEMMLCDDTCQNANNNMCDDGGPNSTSHFCNTGSDCNDCGERYVISAIDYEASQ